MVMGEVEKWQGHSPERLAEMKANLQRLKEQGARILD
jgi:rifampin ADP-ribosylating transferase